MSLRIAFDLDGVLADMDAALVREAVGLFGETDMRKARRARGRESDIPITDAPTVQGTPTPEPPTAATPIQEASLEENKQVGATAGLDLSPLLSLDLTARQQSRLWGHVERLENFWESLDETEPGVVARLAALAAERRWEVIFLTRRPPTAGATAQVQSQRWLEARGFRLPCVYVVQGSRGRIAASLGLDVVVDDRPQNCLDVLAESPSRAVLVWRDGEATLAAAARSLGITVIRSMRDCLKLLAEMSDKCHQSGGIVRRVLRRLRRKDSHELPSIEGA